MKKLFLSLAIAGFAISASAQQATPVQQTAPKKEIKKELPAEPKVATKKEIKEARSRNESEAVKNEPKHQEIKQGEIKQEQIRRPATRE